MVAEPGRVAPFLTVANPVMPINASDTDKINGVLNALVAHGLMKSNDQGDAVFFTQSTARANNWCN